MKTLYVSDLDGTLLNCNSTLSDFSVENLNGLISNGINFTIATSRGYSGVKKIEKLNLNIPVIILNGALIYDVKTKTFRKIEKIDSDRVIEILNISENTRQTSLIVFGVYGNTLNEYYKTSEDVEVQQEIEKTHKNMIYIDSFYELLNQDIVYFNFRNTKEKIDILYDQMKDIKEIDILVHKNIYHDNVWFLECFAKDSNKYSAIKYLRENYNFEKIITFGDGRNDIPLAKSSEEFYATANADEEIKKIAKEVVESNQNDGVVKWLLANAELEE